MKVYRIISNGDNFKIQKRSLLFFWKTVKEREDLDNKKFSGDKEFKTKNEAENYIKSNEVNPWVVSN